MLVLVEHDFAVDDDILDPDVVLKGIGIRGAVGNTLRIKDDQIGKKLRP